MKKSTFDTLVIILMALAFCFVSCTSESSKRHAFVKETLEKFPQAEMRDDWSFMLDMSDSSFLSYEAPGKDKQEEITLFCDSHGEMVKAARALKGLDIPYWLTKREGTYQLTWRERVIPEVKLDSDDLILVAAQ